MGHSYSLFSNFNSCMDVKISIFYSQKLWHKLIQDFAHPNYEWALTLDNVTCFIIYFDKKQRIT